MHLGVRDWRNNWVRGDEELHTEERNMPGDMEMERSSSAYSKQYGHAIANITQVPKYYSQRRVARIEGVEKKRIFDLALGVCKPLSVY